MDNHRNSNLAGAATNNSTDDEEEPSNNTDIEAEEEEDEVAEGSGAGAPAEDDTPGGGGDKVGDSDVSAGIKESFARRSSDGTFTPPPSVANGWPCLRQSTSGGSGGNCAAAMKMMRSPSLLLNRNADHHYQQQHSSPMFTLSQQSNSNSNSNSQVSHQSQSLSSQRRGRQQQHRHQRNNASGNGGVFFGPHSGDNSQSQDQSSMHSNSQSQQETLTQTQVWDLTQLDDDDDEHGPLSSSQLSPLSPYLSPSEQRTIPWARLVPVDGGSGSGGGPMVYGSGAGSAGMDLLPRSPPSNSKVVGGDDVAPMTLTGIRNLLPGDVFNEYTIGRSPKCDVTVPKPRRPDGKGGGGGDIHSYYEWAFGMVSNRHCRIYALAPSPSGALNQQHQLEVFVEDGSGNGTVVNRSCLLRKGERRLLHSGDEVCLVNPHTLRKKVRDQAKLQKIMERHSYIFVNLIQQQPGSYYHSNRRLLYGDSGVGGGGFNPAAAQAAQPFVTAPLPPPSHLPSSSFKRAAVDVRAMRPPPPPPSASTQSAFSAPRACGPPPQRAPHPNSKFGSAAPVSRKPRRVEEDFDLRDLLGSGTVGQVRRAICRRTGIARAVKTIPIRPIRGGYGNSSQAAALQKQQEAALHSEIAILRGLRHPYIVELVDYYVAPAAVHLVMELLEGGDLFDRIVARGSYAETDARRAARRLLATLHYLHHDKNVLHRDIKV